MNWSDWLRSFWESETERQRRVVANLNKDIRSLESLVREQDTLIDENKRNARRSMQAGRREYARPYARAIIVFRRKKLRLLRMIMNLRGLRDCMRTSSALSSVRRTIQNGIGHVQDMQGRDSESSVRAMQFGEAEIVNCEAEIDINDAETSVNDEAIDEELENM